MFPTGIRMRLAVLLNNKRTCGACVRHTPLRGLTVTPIAVVRRRTKHQRFFELINCQYPSFYPNLETKLKSGTVLRARARGIYDGN